jgi:ubiquinone/menaquinone biosynthesis C-methylase UbiE
MQLNLGCYDKKIHGFINVDIRPEVGPDLVDDAFKLESIEENSVDLIYCSHMLEHLKFPEAKQALRRWYTLLKDGGILRLAVPDMEAVFAHYFYWRRLPSLYSALWGSQRHEFDFHYSGWDYQTLSDELSLVGFSDIYRWNPEYTEPHKYIDDYSQAYYPDGHKPMVMKNGNVVDLGGKLMSLNIEAVK